MKTLISLVIICLILISAPIITAIEEITNEYSIMYLIVTLSILGIIIVAVLLFGTTPKDNNKHPQ